MLMVQTIGGDVDRSGVEELLTRTECVFVLMIAVLLRICGVHSETRTGVSRGE